MAFSTAVFSSPVKLFLFATVVNSGFVTGRRSLSWPWVIRTLPSLPIRLELFSWSVATAFRCQELPELYCKSSLRWAFTTIWEGLLSGASMLPVRWATVPVPYSFPVPVSPWKKLVVKAGRLASAFETILNSFNFPLLSDAVKSTVKSSPA